MSTVPITNPANDECAFPDTIKGSFTLANLTALPKGMATPMAGEDRVSRIPPPTITVWVKNEGDLVYLPAILASISTATPNATSGDWSAPKPDGVVAGKTYTIIATLSHPEYNSVNDKKERITA